MSQAARAPIRLITLHGMPVKAPTLPAPTGAILRDEGMALCLKSAHPTWVRGWTDTVYAYPEGMEFTGEDIRLDVTRKLKLLPHSNRCWGSMVLRAMRSGMIEFKVPWIWRIPNDPSSHARPLRVLRRTALL